MSDDKKTREELRKQLIATLKDTGIKGFDGLLARVCTMVEDALDVLVEISVEKDLFDEGVPDHNASKAYHIYTSVLLLELFEQSRNLFDSPEPFLTSVLHALRYNDCDDLIIQAVDRKTMEVMREAETATKQ